MKGDRAGPLRGRRPYIVETNGERHLLFSHDSVQSTMRLDDPDVLTCEYTRRMMSFLLFVPAPREIVMIGLGGGSLAKYCYRHLPDARLTAVEIDADVIALRDEFCIPLDDARFQVLHADGVRYLAHRREPIDVLIVDAFDEGGVAPSLATSEFYRNAAQRLSDAGLLVMNMSGEQGRYDAHLQRIHDAFGDLGLIATVHSGENDLLFAFKSAPQIETGELRARAQRWQSELGLDFPHYLRWLEAVDETGLLRSRELT
jgi:spermidine synthase